MASTPNTRAPPNMSSSRRTAAGSLGGSCVGGEGLMCEAIGSREA